MLKKYAILLAACLGITAVMTGCGPSQKEKDLQQKVDEQQKTIEEQKEKLKTLAIPEVPLIIEYRPSKLNQGLVWTLKNDSGKTLPVKVVLSNKTFGKSKEYDLVINHGQFKEIGHLEGWTASPGDAITITSDGYRETVRHIPQKN